MNVLVSLATNDEHGIDTGHVSAVQLGEAIDLHWAEIGSEPRYSFRGRFLWLSRRRFEVLVVIKHQWAGNWCWSAVTMTQHEAARLLNYLSLDDRWHCEGGWCDLTDAYTEAKVTPELLADCRG